MKTKTIELLVNSLPVKAKFYQKDINEIFIPLLKQLTELYKIKGQRIVVILAAAAGSGKSTLTTYLEMLSHQIKDVEPLQALQMDGFHYPNTYLLSHHIDNDENKPVLKTIKGNEKTFDATSLLKHIQNLNNDIYWPIYSRKLHDVAEEKIKVTGNIILIEGNYLLLNTHPYNEIKNYVDYSIFIKANIEDLKDQLVNRKVLGGSSLNDALVHYKNVDEPNIINILNNSLPADLVLTIDEQRHFFVESQKTE